MRDRNGRFPPGYSGNRAGRPPKYPHVNGSLVERLNQCVTVKQNGVDRELTKKEAMLLRAVQEVLKRNPGVRTIKLVLNALIELQVARHKQASPEPSQRQSFIIDERDSDNAFDAMCLLGIAEPNPAFPELKSPSQSLDGSERSPNCLRIKLKPWVVDAGLARGPVNTDDPDWRAKLSLHTAGSAEPYSHGRW